MLTQCPECRTTFRVSSEQLKVRQGRVRCGHCHGEFNAIEGLIDEPVAAAPPPLPTVTEETSDPGGIWVSSREAEVPEPLAPIAEPPVAETQDESPLPRIPDESPLPRIPDESPLPRIPDESPLPEIPNELPQPVIPDESPEPATPSEPPVAEIAETPSPADVVGVLPPPSPDVPVDEPEPLLDDDEFEPRRWPWMLGIVLATLLLATQAAMHFRVELAAKVPSTRPLLLAACNLVGCQVPLPMEITAIGIDTSDLHPDTDHPGHLQLVATLRNRAGYAQIWPHLEVSLTDAADRILVRKAIPPADYLPAKLKPEAGFPAKGDQLVQLDLQAPDVPAVGYRLYVFYP